MRDFKALFRGREDAHGEYSSLAGRQRTERGKIVSKAQSVAEPVTPALFKDHIAGKHRLGIIPVMADGRVWWFCIDVDFYKIGNKSLADVGGYEKLAKAIEETSLVMTASKSGGAHLWCFLEEPVAALDAKKMAENLVKKLKLHEVLGIEVGEFKQHLDLFPKNDSKTDIAIWVNLPYFGEACHAFDGKSWLDLKGFVEYANGKLTHPDDLRTEIKEVKQAKDNSGEPPCISWMRAEGIPEGHRNECCTQFAIYAMKAFPDTWQDELIAFNAECCNPPLRRDEVAPIIKSVGTKQYEGYMCSKIKELFCDKAECKKRAYGIGKQQIDPESMGIEHIEKIDGEEPVYLMNIGGKVFQCNVEDLYLYNRFRRTALAAINRFLPNMKQGEWEDILAPHLEMMEITQAGADTQMRDRVIKEFQNWCEQSINTDNIDDAWDGNSPYYDGKAIVFDGDVFMSILDRKLKCSRDKAYVYMRDWGTVIMERTIKETKRTIWCWVQKGPLWFDPYKGKQK